MILKNESMRKKKTYEFEMWKLLDLYKNDLNAWREYLYKNMSVFSNIKNNIAIWKNAEDIYQDTFYVIDRYIQKSIKDCYDEKQIYKYIKLRVRWELINRIKKYAEENNQKQIPVQDSGEFISYWDPLEDLNTEYLMEKVSDHVFELEEPYKSIIILHHFVDPRKTFKQIWITLWRTLWIPTDYNTVVADYNRAIKILQSKLKDENIY